MSEPEVPAPEPPKPEPRPCECLKRIRENLTKHHGEGSDVELNLMPSINTEKLDMRMDLPPLYYTYLVGKKRKKSYVHFNYCPFCGKRSV